MGDMPNPGPETGGVSQSIMQLLQRPLPGGNATSFADLIGSAPELPPIEGMPIKPARYGAGHQPL